MSNEWKSWPMRVSDTYVKLIIVIYKLNLIGALTNQTASYLAYCYLSEAQDKIMTQLRKKTKRGKR
jgi:hypothetical protein